jgi:hypothetical protein
VLGLYLKDLSLKTNQQQKESPSHKNLSTSATTAERMLPVLLHQHAQQIRHSGSHALHFIASLLITIAKFSFSRSGISQAADKPISSTSPVIRHFITTSLQRRMRKKVQSFKQKNHELFKRVHKIRQQHLELISKYQSNKRLAFPYTVWP